MPAEIERVGRTLAYSADGDHGAPTLAQHIRGASLPAGDVEAEQWRILRGLRGPKVFPVKLNVDATNEITATGHPIFIPKNRSYEVVAVSEAHTVVDATATANLKLEVCADGDAAASGTDLLAATAINMKATANTIITVMLNQQSTSLTGAALNVVKPGQHLKVHMALDNATATITNGYEGVITVWLRPIEADGNNRKNITYTISKGEDLAATGQCIFIARDHRWKVTSIKEVHGVVQGAVAEYLKVERCQGVEAAAAGDDLLAATDIDLTDTINTVQTGTILTTSNIHILEMGDRLVIHAASSAAAAEATTTYNGCIVVTVEPYLADASGIEEQYIMLTAGVASDWGVLGQTFFIGDDRLWKVKDIDEIHSVIETGVAAPSLQIERCQGTEAVAGGDKLMAAQAIDLDATKDTIQSGTIVTTGDRDVLADGDRLVAYGTNDSASDAAVALTNCEMLVQVRLERTAIQYVSTT